MIVVMLAADFPMCEWFSVVMFCYTDSGLGLLHWKTWQCYTEDHYNTSCSASGTLSFGFCFAAAFIY